MEQRKRVLDRLDEAAPRDGGRSSRDADTGARAIDAGALLPQEEDKLLVARIRPLIVEHTGDGWQYALEERGIEIEDHPFTVDDPKVLQAVKTREVQATLANETTREDLRGILEQSFQEGWTNTQLSDAIGAYYKERMGADKARPQTAARTQVAGVVNDGRLLAAKEVGGLKKGWLHGGSEEPRPEHLAAQSQYLDNPIGLDEKFTVNGHQCDSPGDASLPVGEVANCTCMVVFV